MLLWLGVISQQTDGPKLRKSRVEPKVGLSWAWCQLLEVRWESGCLSYAGNSEDNEAMFSKYLRQGSFKCSRFVAKYLWKWKINNYLWICEDIHSSQTDRNCLASSGWREEVQKEDFKKSFPARESYWALELFPQWKQRKAIPSDI